jgi:hypothetical protein
MFYRNIREANYLNEINKTYRSLTKSLVTVHETTTLQFYIAYSAGMYHNKEIFRLTNYGKKL